VARVAGSGNPTIPDFGDLPDLTGAICADPMFDPDSWFTDDPVLKRVVVQLCWDCPVREECLGSALVQEAEMGGVAYGVRGGLTAAERQPILDGRRH
jgi:hypothetical protein